MATVMAVRFRFARGREAMFLSHLDLMRAFTRAFRRARSPLAYSEGFNPHADLVFGLPLGVAVTSDAEYLDAGFSEAVSPRATMDAVNERMAPGLRLMGAFERAGRQNIMSQITHAAYAMRVGLAGDGVAGVDAGDVGGDGGDEDDTSVAGVDAGDGGGKGDAGNVEAVLLRAAGLFDAAQKCIVIKESKNNKREIDLKGFVQSLAAEGDTLRMTVCAGAHDNIKPDLVLAALNSLLAGQGDGSPRRMLQRLALHRAALFVQAAGGLLPPEDPRVLA